MKKLVVLTISVILVISMLFTCFGAESGICLNVVAEVNGKAEVIGQMIGYNNTVIVGNFPEYVLVEMDRCKYEIKQIDVYYNCDQHLMTCENYFDSFVFKCSPENRYDQFKIEIVLMDGDRFDYHVLFSGEGGGEPYLLPTPIMQ